MGCRRACLFFAGLGVAFTAHAGGEYKKWLNPCAHEGFTALFQKHEYSVKGPYLNPRHRLEAEAAISHGKFDDKPRLTLNLFTRDKDGTRHPLLRGSEQFEDILRFFEGEYVGINALWYEGDNLAEFNRLTASGLKPEEAARQTWTGQQALKHGFTDVKFEKPQRGSPGAYRQVSVYFDRPGARVAKSALPFEVSLEQNDVKFVYSSGPHRFQSIRGRVESGVLMLEVDNRRQGLPEISREHVEEILEFFKGRFVGVRYKLLGLSKKVADDPVAAALAAHGFTK